MAQKKKAFLYVVIFLAALSVSLAYGTGTVRGSSNQKTVKVAYPVQSRITDLDEAGAYSGYTYEYLQEIAQYTGWSYEFVQVDGSVDDQITTLMEMVKTGEVDLMGAVMYNKQLDEDYDFSGYSYGTVETVLQVPMDSSRPVVIDASRAQTIRIAVLSKTGRQINDLNEYCQMNLVTPVLVECAGEEELMAALESGEADVILNSSMSYYDDLRTIARFSPRQFYFITSNNSSGLLTELNEAMANLNQTDPYFQSSLYDKYFTPQIDGLNLSAQEKDYILHSEPLKVGVLNNHPPFQYRDKTDGELKGIGVGLLNHISQETGLKFNMVEAGSQEQLFEMASRGQIDLIAGIPYNYTIASNQRLSMTRPYVTSQYILLLNGNLENQNIAGKRLAIVKSNTYRGYYVGQRVNYNNIDECIRAVNSGEADYTYVDVYTAQYYINLPEFARMKMVPQTYTPSKVCFGIPAPADHNLFNILNKAVLSMSVEEIQGIVYMNTLQQQEFSISAYMQRNPVQAVLIVAGVFTVLFLLMLIIFYQRSKAGKAIALELQKHMRLYSVSNDLIFEYDYNKRDIMLSLPGDVAGKQNILHYNLDTYIEDPEKKRSCKAILDLLEARESRIIEEQLYGIDNNWHWYRIVLEIIYDQAEKPAYAIGRLNQIDGERDEKDKLLEKAQRDSLTHLYNRESCWNLIAKSLWALNDHETGALLILDIDYFKSINDTYGHLRGDEVLTELANLLLRNFRAEDIVGRLGGDEFVVYMGSVKDQESLRRKCEEVCGSARQVKLDSNRCLTVSLGAVLSHSEQTYNELYKSADEALYMAKAAGRNCFYILPDTGGAHGQ